MPPKTQPRLPLAPLLRASGAAVSFNGHNLPMPLTALARIAGVPQRSVARWQVYGVPLFAADRAAVACGLHPSAVWGQEWFDAS